MSIVVFDGPPSWSLDASETGESTKCPWVGVKTLMNADKYRIFIGFCCSCLRDHAMFKRKRLIVNSASGYEKINSDEENEDEQYAEDSPDDVSVDSPIIPANPQDTVKYV